MGMFRIYNNQETVYVSVFTGHFIEIIWIRSLKK